MNDFINILQEKKVQYSIEEDKIFVNGNLNLHHTSISGLPDKLRVGGYLHLHPEEITNIAYRKFLRDDDYTVFAAWINGKRCVVVNSKIYTLGEFFGGVPAADVEQAARNCVAELKTQEKDLLDSESG